MSDQIQEVRFSLFSISLCGMFECNVTDYISFSKNNINKVFIANRIDSQGTRSPRTFTPVKTSHHPPPFPQDKFLDPLLDSFTDASQNLVDNKLYIFQSDIDINYNIQGHP